MIETKTRPLVGVGVLVFKEGKLLLGRRQSSHGAATWTPPGGHLEMNESPEDCAKRETREEAGIAIKNLVRGPYTNDVFREEKKHYVTLFISCEYASGELAGLEPDKTTDWDWFDFANLPSPLFGPLKNLLGSNARENIWRS